jgi:hypothetical protein
VARGDIRAQDSVDAATETGRREPASAWMMRDTGGRVARLL